MTAISSIAFGREFWIGASSSIIGALILAILVYIFKNTLMLARSRRDKGRRESEIFERALEESSRHSLFAYTVVQTRGLRYFLLAVFIAYIGDILEVLNPLNTIAYAIALGYVLQGLRWFYKIERSALKIISENSSE